MWTIFYVETGNSETISEKEARKKFGRKEWKEIKQGYLPHIIAVEEICEE